MTEPQPPTLTRAEIVEALPFEQVKARRGLFIGFVAMVREVWAYRELLVNLTRKELKVKYKDSVLGFLWTLLRPLTQLLVYSLAIGFFLGSNKSIPQFGIYLFSGLLAWTFFSDAVSGSTGCIVANAGLVKKVYFPRELFPLSVVGGAIVNFGLQALVLIFGYLIYGAWPPLTDLGLVPMALLVVVIWSAALGFMLAAANVYLRDMTYLVEVGLMVWFWITPIVYSWKVVRQQLVVVHHWDWAYQLFMANPMANVVLAMQRALWPAGHTPAGAAATYPGNLYPRLAILSLIGLVLFWVGQGVFDRAQGNFAQEL